MLKLGSCDNIKTKTSEMSMEIFDVQIETNITGQINLFFRANYKENVVMFHDMLF